MDKSAGPGRFMELLIFDTTVTESEYKEYRMKLEQALTVARSREKVTLRIVVVSLVMTALGTFAGGSRVFGSFDPWDKQATVLSMACAAVYVVAAVTFWISLAAYYSRFRINVRNTQEQLRDASIMELHREVSELKKMIAAISHK